jgi:hypothetical protein
VNAELITS